MKTQIVLQAPLPPPSGGVATWTKNLLDSPLAEEFDIHLVNVALGRLDLTRAQLFKRRLIANLRSQSEMAQVLWGVRPQVLHICSSGYPASLLRDTATLRLASRLGTKTLVHIHGDAARLGARPEVSTRVLSTVDAIITLGEGSQQSAEAIGLSPVHVLPNSIAAHGKIRRPALSGRPIRLLFVGWLTRTKGLIELLEALRHVPNTELTILGRWVADSTGKTCEDEVRRRIAAPDLASRVTLVGEVPLKEVGSHYAASDALVLPSHTEGFPMVLLEAMASGLPCIVTPVGAMPEAITDGFNGHIVPVNNAIALAKTLSELRPGALKTMGRNAYTRVHERYTHEVVYKKLANLWRILAR